MLWIAIGLFVIFAVILILQGIKIKELDDKVDYLLREREKLENNNLKFTD